MHFVTNGFKRFSKTNSTDPRQRVPLRCWITAEIVTAWEVENPRFHLHLYQMSELWGRRKNSRFGVVEDLTVTNLNKILLPCLWWREQESKACKVSSLYYEVVSVLFRKNFYIFHGCSINHRWTVTQCEKYAFSKWEMRLTYLLG